MSPEELEALKRALRCTTGELARTLNVDATTVVKWESGELFPTKRHVEQMKALAERGPDAIVRAAKGARAASPLAALADPKLWEILRKLAAHPRLLAQVTKLAEGHPDPADD
ncbi:MAG: XRE family transcriptional regulator [Myxococcales bacterium]|nr:XRE family transcriptional regulator [Myxococcales bacterium]